MLAAQPDRDVAREVDAEGDELAEVGGQRRTGNAQRRDRAKAEDQDGVEHDVADTARDQRDHGGVHLADGLKELLKGQVRHVDRGEQEHDGRIEHAHRHQPFVRGEAAQESGHDGNADHRTQDAVQQGQRHAVGRGDIRLFAVTRAEVERDLRVDADAKTNGDGIDEVLDRVDQRKGRHGVLANAGDEQAVHNVVQRVDQHRDDVGQGHGEQQREHRPGFHKGIVHFLCFLSEDIKRTRPATPKKAQKNATQWRFRGPLCGEK